MPATARSAPERSKTARFAAWTCSANGTAPLRNVRGLQPQVAPHRSADHRVGGEPERSRLLLALDVHQDVRRHGLAGRSIRTRSRARPRHRRGRAAIHVQPADHPPHRAPQEQEEQREQPVLEGRERERLDGVREHYTLRYSITVVPTVIRSPSDSGRDWTCCPFSLVPFVDPRSVSVERPSFVRICACRRDTPLSSIVTSLSGWRPIVTISLSSGTRRTESASCTSSSP